MHPIIVKIVKCHNRSSGVMEQWFTPSSNVGFVKEKRLACGSEIEC